MEAIEVDGLWWLPSAPDASRIPGTLRVSETGRAELILIGALTPFLERGERGAGDAGETVVTFSESSSARSGIYPRIHGVTVQTSFTLDDCFETHRSSQLFTGMESQRIHANQVFRGVLLDEAEPQAFDEAYVEMDWLAFWVRKSGIKESHRYAKNESGTEVWVGASLEVESLPDERIIGPQAVIKLGQKFGVHGDSILERRFSQDFYFGIEFGQLTPLNEILEQASDLQDLVTMGTGRVATYKSFSLRHPDLTRRIGGHEHRRPIDYFVQWNVDRRQPIKTLTEYDMKFTLNDLGGSAGIEQWLKVASIHRSALGRVMATRYSDGMFVSDRVLNCSAALEGFDRDKHNDRGETVYIDRIKRCIDLVGQPFAELVGNTDAWATALKNERNNVAHHNPRATAGSTEQHILAETAYWLFTFCMLREARIQQAAFDRMAGHRQYRWLRERVLEVMPQA